MVDDEHASEAAEADWSDYVAAGVFFVFIIGAVITGSLGWWSPTAEDNPDLGEIGSNISVEESNSSSRAAIVSLDVNVSTVSDTGELVFKREGVEASPLSNFTLIGFDEVSSGVLEGANESCLAEFNESARDRTRAVLSDARVGVFKNTETGGYDVYWFSSNESEHVGLSLAREGLAVYTGPGDEPAVQQQARADKRGVWACLSDE